MTDPRGDRSVSPNRAATSTARDEAKHGQYKKRSRHGRSWSELDREVFRYGRSNQNSAQIKPSSPDIPRTLYKTHKVIPNSAEFVKGTG